MKASEPEEAKESAPLVEETNLSIKEEGLVGQDEGETEASTLQTSVNGQPEPSEVNTQE